MDPPHPQVIVFRGKRYILESALRDNPKDETYPRFTPSDPVAMSVYMKYVFDSDDGLTPYYTPPLDGLPMLSAGDCFDQLCARKYAQPSRTNEEYAGLFPNGHTLSAHAFQKAKLAMYKKFWNGIEEELPSKCRGCVGYSHSRRPDHQCSYVSDVGMPLEFDHIAGMFEKVCDLSEFKKVEPTIENINLYLEELQKGQWLCHECHSVKTAVAGDSN